MAKKLPKNQLSEDRNYLTSDLGAAASLITKGFKLISLEKSNPRKVQFIFQETADIKKVIEEYWSNKLELEARAAVHVG